MKIKFKAIFAVLLCCASVFSTGCSKEHSDTTSDVSGGGNIGPVTDVVDSSHVTYSYSDTYSITGDETNDINPDVSLPDNFEFDFNLLEYMSTTSNGNCVVSPIALMSSIDILLNGSSGETHDALLSSVKVGNEDDVSRVLRNFDSFRNEFLVPGAKLDIYHCLWKKFGTSDYKTSFLNQISSRNVAQKYINSRLLSSDSGSWVSGCTDGRITTYFDKNRDVSGSQLIIADVLDIVDRWGVCFENAGPSAFYDELGFYPVKKYITCTEELYYYKDDRTEFVSIPLESELAFTIVIGDVDNLADMLYKAEKTVVSVLMPVIDLNVVLDKDMLNGFLKKNGASVVFGSADFSKMYDGASSLSEIAQRIKITVDENGLNAPSNNKVPNDLRAEEYFIANKPFTFFVHTADNGNTGVDSIILLEGNVCK